MFTHTFRTFPEKKNDPGHLRLGHHVESNDLIFEDICDCTVPSVEDHIETFKTMYVPTRLENTTAFELFA